MSSVLLPGPQAETLSLPSPAARPRSNRHVVFCNILFCKQRSWERLWGPSCRDLSIKKKSSSFSRSPAPRSEWTALPRAFLATPRSGCQGPAGLPRPREAVRQKVHLCPYDKSSPALSQPASSCSPWADSRVHGQAGSRGTSPTLQRSRLIPTCHSGPSQTQSRACALLLGLRCPVADTECPAQDVWYALSLSLWPACH